MQKTWLLAIVLALSPTLTWGQTTEELNTDGKNPDNVLTQSMGLARNSYSPLAQINKSNIKRQVEIYPSRGSNAVPIAFNPTKGLVYAAPWDEPRIQQLAPLRPFEIGATSTGVNARQPQIEPGQVVGYFIAMDPLTGQRKWEVPLTDIPSSAGMLVTGGGLVFTGKLTGEFLALDEDSGKTLWQFQTSSAINSTAITYTHNGRQYVTVASGLGGILARRAVNNKVPTGDSLWTFALLPE
jgi:alcohol dehydrogenase (cytochrome c)